MKVHEANGSTLRAKQASNRAPQFRGKLNAGTLLKAPHAAILRHVAVRRAKGSGR